MPERSLTDQKAGLKISILNLKKVNGKYLVGFFLTKNQETQSKRVIDFIQVLFFQIFMSIGMENFTRLLNTVLQR